MALLVACGGDPEEPGQASPVGPTGRGEEGQDEGFGNTDQRAGGLSDAGVVCVDGGSRSEEFAFEACAAGGPDASLDEPPVAVPAPDAAVPSPKGQARSPSEPGGCLPGQVVCGSLCVGPDMQCQDLCGGMRYTCMLRDGEVWCWGENAETGAVGAGTPTTQPVPTPARILGDTTRLSCGWAHACAISQGTTYCWGFNQFHDVDPASDDLFVLSPRAVRDDAINVSAGGFFTCFELVDGSIECIGQNSSAQHGDSMLDYSPNPPASGPPVTTVRDPDKLVAGQRHVCALVDRRVMCWGSNNLGELGRGVVGPSTSLLDPDWVPGFDEVDDIAGAGGLTCLLTRGEVWCWGHNRHYALGTSADRPCPDTECASGEPRRIEGLGPVTRIEVGSFHACARVEDAGWWCWGRGREGQLGDGRPITVQDSTSDADDAPHVGDEVPVPIAGGYDFELFGMGVVHSCGTVGTDLYCWGGSRGETTHDVLTSEPTMVAPF